MPRHAHASSRKPVVFDPATIEEKLPGTMLETKPDEGWAWSCVPEHEHIPVAAFGEEEAR